MEADDDRLDAALAQARPAPRSSCHVLPRKRDRRDRTGSARPACRRRDSAGVRGRRTPADRRRRCASFAAAATRSRNECFSIRWQARLVRLAMHREASLLVLASARPRHGRRRLRPLGPADDRVSHQRRRRMGIRAPGPDRRDRRARSTPGASRCSASTPTTATRSPTAARTRGTAAGCRRSTTTTSVQEVIPFVRSHCQRRDIGVWTMGASLGGYHAANTLLKHPDVGQALLRAVGRLRHEAVHGRRLRRQLLFQQPGRLRRQPDRTAGRWHTWRAATSTSRPAPGRGSIATRRTGCRGSSRAAASAHHLDDWGPHGRPRLAVLAASDAGVHELRADAARCSMRDASSLERCIGIALVSASLTGRARPVRYVPLLDHLRRRRSRRRSRA